MGSKSKNFSDNKNSQIKFKASMLKLSLFDYSDRFIVANGTVTIDGARTDDNGEGLDGRNKRVIFKNCVPFTDCISEINNTQIVNPKGLNVVMSMFNLVEYRNDYLKTPGGLWQHYKDEPNYNI